MSEQQWHMAKHGHQVGPMSEAEIVSNIQNDSADGQTLVFTAGMSNWTPLADVPQLATHLLDGQTSVPPLLPGRTAHEIDFTIEGAEMQYVEVELDPGESAVAEAGVICAASSSVRGTRFSAQPRASPSASRSTRKSAWGCLAARVLSCSGSRVTGYRSCMPAAQFT